jgi:hypothetical protein
LRVRQRDPVALDPELEMVTHGLANERRVRRLPQLRRILDVNVVSWALRGFLRDVDCAKPLTGL